MNDRVLIAIMNIREQHGGHARMLIIVQYIFKYNFATVIFIFRLRLSSIDGKMCAVCHH